MTISESLKSKIPQVVATQDIIHSVQCAVMLVSFACTIALTQKLCDDNKIGPVRFSAHVVVQAVGMALTLYLMLTPDLEISAYR